jgi:hypothetical protein
LPGDGSDVPVGMCEYDSAALSGATDGSALPGIRLLLVRSAGPEAEGNGREQSPDPEPGPDGPFRSEQTAGQRVVCFADHVAGKIGSRKV